jgi:hypothetical protein
MAMGFPWKAVLNGVVAVAAHTVPGGTAVDAVVHEAIKAKAGNEKDQAIFAAIMTRLNELEVLKPGQIADPAKFNKGLVDAHAAFDEISQSISRINHLFSNGQCIRSWVAR